MIEFHVTVRNTMSAGIRNYASKVPPALKRGTLRFMQRVLKASQSRVPYDRGDLHDSGRVEQSEKGYAARVVYGGPGIPYAVPVHEHLSQFSPYSWRVAEATGRGIRWTKAGTGPKYLERPLFEMISEALPEVAEEFKRL